MLCCSCSSPGNHLRKLRLQRNMSLQDGLQRSMHEVALNYEVKDQICHVV